MKLGELSEAQYRKYYEVRLEGRSLCRSGDGYVTKCPFHDDAHASLAINVRKGVWNCFAGCGSGGVLDFERKLSYCDREAAYRQIAEIVGIPYQLRLQQEAIYSYTDPFGKELFQVVRMQTSGSRSADTATTANGFTRPPTFLWFFTT